MTAVTGWRRSFTRNALRSNLKCEAYFRAKEEIKCFYKGRQLKKRYVPDLFVLGCLVVELKAVTELAPEHEAQLINYMRLCQQPVGYLVNFGHKGTLEWKRFILSEFIPDNS